MAQTIEQVLSDRIHWAGKRVVDVGSGTGELVRWLHSQGADAVGVECGELIMQRALVADPEHPERYVDGVAQDLPFGEGSVDVVIFSASLHHVPVHAMATALTEAARVICPGGSLFVSEPLAQGPAFDIARLIEDETDVRAAAQLALDATRGLPLDETEPIRYVADRCYNDFADYESRAVGIDPGRALAIDQHRAEISRRFHANARRHDGRYWFEQEILVRIFHRSTAPLRTNTTSG